MLMNHIGDIRVDRIIEQEFPMFDPAEFLPELTKEMIDPYRSWLEPKAFDPVSGLMTFCMQSYVIRTGHHNILVDTCIGNHKNHPARPAWHQKTDSTYMDALNKAGLTVDDIDYVMCTHLHPDHVGWNTRLENGRWVPTFPNAKYLFSEKELAHWEQANAKTEIPYVVDSVLPVVAAGRVTKIKSDFQLDDMVWCEPSPGHTPDHFSVCLAHGGHTGVLTGDLIHSPIQMVYPETPARPDVDKPLAAKTRRAFLEKYADTSTMICTHHFPSPSMGHIHSEGDSFRFKFLTG